MDFPDIDGNFVQEFQTRGFSPRVLELALFAYLRELPRSVTIHY